MPHQHASVSRSSSAGLLAQARMVLAEAEGTPEPAERYRLAHLAALRVAAAVVAERGRPASTRRRLMSVWVLLDRVAPEYGDWSSCFVAGAATRVAIESGSQLAVSRRAADDQLRAAWEFLSLVEHSLGLVAA